MRLLWVLHLFFCPLLTTSLVLPHLIPSLDPTNLTLPVRNPQPVCVRIIDQPMIGLRPTVCELVAMMQCTGLFSVPDLIRSQWHWTEQPGCAVGWYFPAGARIPSFRECEQSIYWRIILRCARHSQFNGGTINVKVLPNFESDGQATFRMQGMYIVSPERLTL